MTYLDDSQVERRAVTELRVAGRRLEGYVATFNSEARIGDFTEVIAPGAFGDDLRNGRDIVALVDHDQARLLARTRSGTLRLVEDGKGLAFSLDVPETQPGRDVLALAERGDLGVGGRLVRIVRKARLVCRPRADCARF